MGKLKSDTKYLRNPLFISRKKSESFHFIIDKLKPKPDSGKARSLSWIGRATLIRSSLKSITVYYMSLFDLPRKVCKKMQIFGGQN